MGEGWVLGLRFLFSGGKRGGEDGRMGGEGRLETRDGDDGL